MKQTMVIKPKADQGTEDIPISQSSAGIQECERIVRREMRGARYVDDKGLPVVVHSKVNPAQALEVQHFGRPLRHFLNAFCPLSWEMTSFCESIVIVPNAVVKQDVVFDVWLPVYRNRRHTQRALRINPRDGHFEFEAGNKLLNGDGLSKGISEESDS